MRLAKIDTLAGEEIIAKPIYDSHGRQLLSAGTRFRKSFVTKLAQYGIDQIYIEDKISTNVTIEDKISIQTRQEATQLVKDTMTKFKLGKLRIESVIDITTKIIDDLLNSNFIYDLKDIKLKDNYTFQHSVNVGLLSALVGCNLKMDRHKLEAMVSGCLLHDIGKIQIPDEILNKPGKLSDEEFEEIKKHPTYGYNALGEYLSLSSFTKVVVLMHHEKVDGTGYPLGFDGSKIHPTAKIAAVCDVFDALTSDRPYRKAWTISQTLEYIQSKAGTDFDPEIVKGFLNCVTPYPNGAIVALNNGDVAIVVKQNKPDLTKPDVQLLYNRISRKVYPEDMVIRLENNSNLYIDGETDIDYTIYLAGRVL